MGLGVTSGPSGDQSLLPLLLCCLLCAHLCQGLKMWLEQSGKHSKLVSLFSGTAGKGRRWLLVGVQWDLIPAPPGFPGSSQPSMPAARDLGAFLSGSRCLRVIHRPQPLMDSIQLLLPRPPRHCDSCSGWKQIPFGSESPRYFIFTHHFLPGISIFPFSHLRFSPFSSIHAQMGSWLWLHHPPSPPHTLLRVRGAGCIPSCRNGRGCSEVLALLLLSCIYCSKEQSPRSCGCSLQVIKLSLVRI